MPSPTVLVVGAGCNERLRTGTLIWNGQHKREMRRIPQRDAGKSWPGRRIIRRAMERTEDGVAASAFNHGPRRTNFTASAQTAVALEGILLAALWISTACCPAPKAYVPPSFCQPPPFFVWSTRISSSTVAPSLMTYGALRDLVLAADHHAYTSYWPDGNVEQLHRARSVSAPDETDRYA